MRFRPRGSGRFRPCTGWICSRRRRSAGRRSCWPSCARGWHRAAALLVAIVALYRAVLFIHEITHRAGRELPAFTLVWNVLVGVPLLIPSFLYQGVHTDHHRQSCYGTEADPEYMPFGRRPPVLIFGAALASLLAPVALAVRFGMLAPLSWAIPAAPPVGRGTLLGAGDQSSLPAARTHRASRPRAGSRRVPGVLDRRWPVVERTASHGGVVVLGRRERRGVGHQRRAHVGRAPLRPGFG